MFSRYLWPLFLVLVPVLISYVYITDRPDLKYTLSDPIPMAFANVAGNPGGVVQQLEIKNVGGGVAKKVVLKIDQRMVDAAVVPYARSDRFESFLSDDSFELIYPEVPPEGNFKVVIRALTKGVEPEDVSISHDSGTAVNALERRTDASSFIYQLSYVFLLLYLVLAWRETRKFMLDYALSARGVEGFVELLNKKNPWHISEEKWRKEKQEAVLKRIREGTPWGGVDEMEAYVFLSDARLCSLVSDDGGVLRKNAIEAISKRFKSIVNSTARDIELLKLLEVKKPEEFPIESWAELQDLANRRYANIRSTFLFMRKEELARYLSEDRPSLIKTEIWDELRRSWSRKYLEQLIEELLSSKDVAAMIENANSDVLNDSDKELWMSKVRLVEAVEKRARRANKMADLWAEMERREIPTEKPDDVDAVDWIIYKNATNSLKSADQLLEREREINMRIGAFESDRRKVSEQLRFIHEMLNDPGVVERKESYDVSFEHGNWANLKKLAALMKETMKETNGSV